MNKTFVILFVLLAISITGCASDASDPSAPATAIEAYLSARIAKDSNVFQGTYCADFEATAITEFDSFGAVDAELTDMACSVDSIEDGVASVSCTGSVDVVYDGENTNSIDLARATYRATQDEGEWKMCGYSQ